MSLVLQLIKDLWYLWLIMILLSILKGFEPKIKGYFGEKAVSRRLSKLNPSKYKVINNLMLQVGNKTTQIDHIVVSNYGIFVIETKNYKGWIIGNEYDEYWKQVIYKRKEKLYNPIKQNYGHIMALKETLKEYKDLSYISVVTFTTNADLKVNATTDVIYTTRLLKTIKKYRENIVSDENKEAIYSRLLSLNIDSKESRKTHVQAIRKDIKEKDNRVKADLCPKCGGELIARNGKYGQFKGCSNFPRCRFTVK